MAFGARRVVHSELNEITSLDLPAVIECVETADRIAAVLPALDEMIGSGLITLERAEVVIYRPSRGAQHGGDAPGDWPPPGGPSSDTHGDERRSTVTAEREVPMHGLKGERTLMRIHVGESDRHEGAPLYESIVQLLRKHGYAGATVFRGVMGFGANAQLHVSKLFRLSSDLPIVIECVETEERIRQILPELDGMIEGGLITLERARVILYRPDAPGDDAKGAWSTDITGSWQAGPGA
jgi:PII-like signaling protein